MDKQFFINNLWRWKCEKTEIDYEIKNLKIDTLYSTEWSHQFETLCRNRLVMGAFRYGLLNDPEKKQYHRILSIKKRISLYLQSGNTEHLVDIANLCLMEFQEGTHPLKHFSAIDDGEHTESKQ